MQHIDGLHEQASDCLRLADAAESVEQRMLLIGMAHAWLALAEQRERMVAVLETDAQHLS